MRRPCSAAGWWQQARTRSQRGTPQGQLALSAARRRTFDQCAAAYIKAHRGSWKSAKHAAQWESTLAAYASPVFGSLSVADVDTELVVRALRPIWESRTETATRLRGRIECILDWATVSEYRQGDNPARWRGHLDGKSDATGNACQKLSGRAAGNY